MLLSDVCLSDVCLTSVASSGLTREQRGLGRLKLARDSDTAFKVKRSKVKVTRPFYSSRRLRTGSCSGQRGNVLSVGNCCYVAVCRCGGQLGGARRYGAHSGRRGAGAYCVATRTAYLTSCRRAAATICPAPLLPPWAPKPLSRPSRRQRCSCFPRPTRSHAHRYSCLTRQHGGG